MDMLSLGAHLTVLTRAHLGGPSSSTSHTQHLCRSSSLVMDSPNCLELPAFTTLPGSQGPPSVPLAKSSTPHTTVHFPSMDLARWPSGRGTDREVTELDSSHTFG